MALDVGACQWLLALFARRCEQASNIIQACAFKIPLLHHIAQQGH